MAQSAFLDRFARFCISSDANALASGCSLVIEGQYIEQAGLACPIVPDKPVPIMSERFVEQMFGAGSVLSNMIKTAMSCCTGGLNITAIPRKDLTGGVKAVYSLPITGTATSDGILLLYWLEAKWNVRIRVSTGDTAATVAGGTLTLTAKNAGTVGNYLAPIFNWSGLVDLAPCGLTFGPTTRTTAGSGNPAPIDYASALGTCCYKCYALGTDDAVWQEGLRAYLDTKWDCNKPQCFGHGFTYNVGTVGQILATWDNQASLSSMARPVNPRSLPYLDVAAQAALRCCSACDNPELSIQGPEKGNLKCVRSPAHCSTEWTQAEMEALQEKGFTVLLPAQGGTGGLTSQYVNQDTTRYVYDEQNRKNITWRDVNSRYLDAALAERWGKFLSQFNGLALATGNTQIKPGKFATNKRLVEAKIHAYFRSQVGDTISEFDDIRRDIVVMTDEEMKGACIGEPGVFYVKIQPQRLVRIKGFYGDFVPKMWDNCDRSFAA